MRIGIILFLSGICVTAKYMDVILELQMKKVKKR